MDAREGLDLVKMSVAVMLLTLVIGATVSFWYIMADHSSNLQQNLDNATRSAAMERLYELQDSSDSAEAENNRDGYPLVTNVANTVSEFNEESLLYIRIRDEANSIVNGATYTYADVTLTNLSNVQKSYTPTSDAVRLLLRYSKYRCKFRITNYNYENNNFNGLEIIILNG